MAIKQLSVYVDNRPGKLAGVVSKISKAGVNMRAISVADTIEFGIVRLIVSDIPKAEEALGGESIFKVTDVVAAKMNDKPGALSDILDCISGEGINIDYMYAFAGAKDFGAYVVLRVADVDAAEKALHSNGIQTLTDEDMKAL